jgi:NAD(P)-dependent dehydrogenase (short-subunit alcohol dehydrogenase family)
LTGISSVFVETDKKITLIQRLASENRIVYGSTKSAVNMLTQSMALELAPFHITVNAVAPGVVDSRMCRVRLNTPELRKEFAGAIPLNRLATPQDVADCVLFLSSPYANYISRVKSSLSTEVLLRDNHCPGRNKRKGERFGELRLATRQKDEEPLPG